ncbi:MAG: tol-pal system protein YbgF [Candidatus Adiutrix sp.]|nr:tol-pal system protein YbgF [Candidatus Adiutrix sp.]
MALFLVACQSVGAGSYVGRGEFDTLTRRVEVVEDRMGLSPRDGGLPVLVSTGAPAPPPPSMEDLAPPPSSSTLAALKPPPGQPPARPPAMVFGPGSTEAAVYQEGQDLLKAGQYGQAAGVFSRMLAENPGGRLAPNARYWLGECYYAQGRYGEAAGEFQRCADDYPGTDKAADALLKLSFSYDRLGDGPRAMAALDRLLGRYPDSSAAGLVKSGRGHF